jgi:hypothetical protein
LTLGGETIEPPRTPIETGVQVFPTKINSELTTPYWLPSYFTQWYGASLVLPDDRAAQLDESGALAEPGSYGDANITKQPDQKGGLYEPLLPERTELEYGVEYGFRVRLTDLAGGGPAPNDDELNDAPSSSACVQALYRAQAVEGRTARAAHQPGLGRDAVFRRRSVQNFAPAVRLPRPSVHRNGQRRCVPETRR